MGIFKENLKYIIAVIIIWIIAFPVVYYYRHKMLSSFALLFYPDDYSPGTTRELVAEGDEVLADNHTDPQMMATACEIYLQYQDRENLFYQPKWVESQRNWSSDKSRSASGVGHSRGILPLTINPQEYWKEHINTVLESLDYYKKAMHYSGPEILPAEKAETAALAACRPEEIVLGYSNYIYNTEQYVLKKMKKDNLLPSGLGEKQYQYIAWSAIRNGKLVNDYLKGLGKLVFTAGLIKNSPMEADSFLERMLFFSQDSEWERNRLYFRRAELNARLGESDPGYLPKAILYYETSAEFNRLDDVSPARIQVYIGHIFEAKILAARLYLKLNQPEKSLQILQGLQSRIHQIDGSMNKALNSILTDYKSTLKDTYRKLGRLEEADEIDT